MYLCEKISLKRRILLTRNVVSILILLFLTQITSYGVQGTKERIKLDHLATGSITSFVRSPSGQWGIEIAGDQYATFLQPHPIQIELYQSNNDVRQLYTGMMDAGVQILTWDGRDNSGQSTASGMYFLRMVAGTEVRTGRVVVVR